MIHKFSILVFPSCDSRKRFLLHQIVSIYFPSLKTVSVGTSQERRTIVYKMSLEESGIDTLCSSMDKVSTSTSGPSKKTAPSKKPSAPLYVPPRARSKSPEELKSNGDDADDDDASWDTIYDDSGNCIKPELVEEFKSTIGIKPDKQVLVQQAKCDMSDKLNGSIHPHVLELHDFDPSLKESDIAMRLSSLK